MSVTNRQRAAWAERAVNHFTFISRGDDDTTAAITDLVANIGHYADRSGLDYLALLQNAIGHWHTETTMPHDGDMCLLAPAVSITIHSTHND